jgi:large subunit ribosomal protein L21e
MPHSFGLRSRTRHMFAVPFGEHGPTHLSTYMINFKLGDIVDIKGSGKVHKGMPHKYYHGKTGRVWNVTPRAVGVEVNKQVRNRIIRKRIHVRVEHIKRSTCQADFVARRKENDKKRHEAAQKKRTWCRGPERLSLFLFLFCLFLLAPTLPFVFLFYFVTTLFLNDFFFSYMQSLFL